jgi:hypothetical protein
MTNIYEPVKTETVTFNWEAWEDYEYRYLNTLLGCKILWTSKWDGARRIGTLEELPELFLSAVPLRVVFEDGTWAMLDETFQIVMAEVA